MRIIAASVPRRLAATVQALYGALGVGAATAFVAACSGWLYGQLGAHAYWVMSVLSLAALPVAAKLRARGGLAR
jgi:PPP family 3-phenylpropionic acid transporter